MFEIVSLTRSGYNQIYESLLTFQRLKPSPILPYASGLSQEVNTHTLTLVSLCDQLMLRSESCLSFCLADHGCHRDSPVSLSGS